ncbi:MAG TPA: prolipoprotein diacylglyceryl transferase [Stellaceae bacterium]|nr:prolipoprotein diacylglyceryl transferase [Stellaceae bacterium]
MMFSLAFPTIDPVLLQIGPFAIRWYALAYIAGLVIGWRYCMALAKRPPYLVKSIDIDDFLVWATLGVVLGGRIGYVLFYRPGYYITEPLEALALWHGGMSFHGGCIGVILALFLFARQRGIPFFALSDIVACATPIGLFFGRLANFINGELWGRATDVPWAMVFPNAGPEPRHPSQLYQATLEGVILFLVLLAMQAGGGRNRPGRISGTFLIGYAVARSVGELFRQPDAQLGFLVLGVTMGQLLSLPMLLAGIYMVVRAKPVASVQPV